MTNVEVNQAGIDLVKQFEGCRLEAYPDPATGGAPWTIGWGHTEGVNPGMKITQHQADVMLQSDLDLIGRHVEAYAPACSSNEHAALCSFAYNLGLNRLAQSGLLAEFIGGDINSAADLFLRYDMAGGKHMPGLQARRQAERALFLTPDTVSDDVA